MELKNKLYPYPVLHLATDDYKNSSFSASLAMTKSPRSCKLEIDFNLVNPELKSLIDDQKAEFLVHVECSPTSFREVYSTNQDKLSISLKDELVDGKVDVNTFIVAKEDIRHFTSKAFNEDYAGLTFNFNRGNILAIGNQYKVSVDHTSDELEYYPSIFTICKYNDQESDVNYILDSDKIEIGLSEDIFASYQMLAKNKNLNITMFAMIIVPALQYVFETLRTQEEDYYNDFHWYGAIKNGLKKLGIELNQETLESKPSYYLANILMNNPMAKGLQAIIDISTEEEDE